MGELDAHRALELIASRKEKERLEGLQNLKLVLEHNQRQGPIEQKTYHALFDELYRHVNIEKNSYIKATRSASKTVISNSLEALAKGLRVVVDLGVRQFRSNAVRNLLDHILDALPLTESGYCIGYCLPLLNGGYIKCFRRILEYQPHVEHLKSKDWIKCADFCLEAIASLDRENDGVHSAHTSSHSRSRTPIHSSERVTASMSIRPSGKASNDHLSKDDTDEFVICLRHLAQAPNSPLLEKTDSILTILFGYLQVSGKCSHDAFVTINLILQRSSLESNHNIEKALPGLIQAIKNTWSLRNDALKREMLTSLIHVKRHLCKQVLYAEDDSVIVSDLEALADILYNDCTKKSDRDCLQLDDIRLSCSPHNEASRYSLSIPALSLQNSRGEVSWMTLYFTAHFIACLDHRKRIIASKDEDYPDDEGGSSVKRLRISDYIDNVINQLQSPYSQAKVAALQVLTFLICQEDFSEDLFRVLVDKLVACVSDDNSASAAWALVAIASSAFHNTAQLEGLKGFWISIWQLASKNITTPSACRAACLTMNVLFRLSLVKYTDIAESVESILSSMELNGPAILSESSIEFLVTVLNLRTADNPSHFNATSERIINWLFSKWVPSLFGERTYRNLNSRHTRASDLIDLLYVCMDRSYVRLYDQLQYPLGPISQTWRTVESQKPIAEYMILSKDEVLDFGLREIPPMDFISIDESTSISVSMETKIVEYCIGEIEQTRLSFNDWVVEKPQNVSSEIIRLVTILCVVGSNLASIRPSANTRRAETLNAASNSLIVSLTGFVNHRECSQEKLDSLLDVLAYALPVVDRAGTQEKSPLRSSGTMQLSNRFVRVLEDRKKSKDSFYFDEVVDPMEMDDEFESQQSRGGPTLDLSSIPSQQADFLADVRTFRSCIAMHTHFVALLSEPEDLGDATDYLPSSFVDHLLSLQPNEFLYSHRLLTKIIASHLLIQVEDIDGLLMYISENFLTSYEYKQNEVVMVMCLEIMRYSVTLWSDPAYTSLYNLGNDLYHWVITVLLDGPVASSVAQLHIVDLLQNLLEVKPDYAQTLNLPSVRTSLFSILQTGTIRVKYHVAEGLSDIFSHFILAKHDTVFDDVHNSLPMDTDFIEGIAVRLLVLSKLGSAWHTLLRRCLYHIFETAGMIPLSVPYATHCIEILSSSLRLSCPEELFKLFARQLLFTWLGSQSLESIPYAIFQYRSLKELLSDCQDEAFGQLFMRRREDDLQSLTAIFDTDIKDALKQNFAKTAAYSISWDTCFGSARNNRAPSSEITLREILGNELYRQQVQQHFSQIIGIVLSCMEQEEQVTKAFSRNSQFHQASKIFSEITTISSSSLALPPAQQPSFNSKYLVFQVDRICRRIAYDSVGFWTPNIFVYAARMLFNQISPALGSLHACSIIKKIRILISLAGGIAVTGYPLQMLLHTLRPFVTDRQCAEDALGIMQFLFDRGRSSLNSHSSFVAGIGLSTLLTLQVALGSSQDSTTQENQHKATMSKAHAFHTWISKYLDDYGSQQAPITLGRGSGASIEAFRSIMNAASNFGKTGDSKTGLLEVKLLMEVLDDERSGRMLLSQSSRNLALNLICKNFGSSEGGNDDITEDREYAAKFAPRIWESCRQKFVGTDYLIWSARMIGRTYSLNGTINTQSGRANQSRQAGTSRALVMKTLSDLLYSDEKATAGLAEKVLGLIISNAPKDESLIEIDETLDNDIILALSSEDHDPFEIDHTTSLGDIATTMVDNVSTWIKGMSVALCNSAGNDPVLAYLPIILQTEGLPERLFPLILHLVLHQDFDRQQKVKQIISQCFRMWFKVSDKESVPQIKLLLDALSYLRTQEIPRETNQSERQKWLDLDYLEAAQAAARCEMYEFALLLAETSAIQPLRSSRRSSAMIKLTIPTELQLDIYSNIDEPDSYYGVEQKPSLSSVLRRLDHEGDGMKSLLFRGAEMDSQIRRARQTTASDSRGMVKSLTLLNLNSVTRALLSTELLHDSGHDTADGVLYAARKLQQWDVRAPESSSSESAVLFRLFQGIQSSSDLSIAQKHVRSGFLKGIKSLLDTGKNRQPISSSLRTLAVLSETEDLINSTNDEELGETWHRLEESQSWLQGGRFEDVRPILSCRETLLSVLGMNERLRGDMHLSVAQIRKVESNALIFSSRMYRKHEALQDSLASATYLTDIAKESSQTGFTIEAAAVTEISNVLWDQSETTTAISMLKELIDDKRLESQMSEVDRSACLAKLGYYIGEARLEKPEEIIENYLMPAIKELRGQGKGSQAGQVHHIFASFCDKQLQNSDAIEDIARLQVQMKRKLADANEYERLAKLTKSKTERRQNEHQSRQSRKWYDLDEQEYRRLRKGRETFLQQSLENYLLSLRACEEFNNDVLRVFALWLEFSDSDQANNAVRKRIQDVPSRKFVTLMNQLASRLQDETTNFQTLLSELVFKICVDHPYHGMHQIYAGAMPLFVRDEAAKSRNASAIAISRKLKSHEKAKTYWQAIYESNRCYHDLAMSKDENPKNSRTFSLDKHSIGKKMMMKVPTLRVPPATMSIELRPDCDYSNVPKLVGFSSTATIASGLSAPKIITVQASNGLRYKQLFKSGNDDLRQDAIMEQVFEQVSKLLRNHAATRLRNLHIRTYKVLPLSGQSGLMEFVQNTLPLVSYLTPAHHRYNPKDWKWDFCRSAVSEVQGDPIDSRVKRFRSIADHFNPVMRYFFLERFGDPSEWFAKRLAYTRTTAAISILGHVLGLGDRHCANILLDERSGEVVHIDLGVAFEAGRVLPVPEVVPFRLTRDLVDAMGYARTEGVFRRCCEFTLDTLRDERESIMTLLNVLRYDPLVNWSISPVRAKRMQEQQQQDQEGGKEGNAAGGAGRANNNAAADSARKKEDEAGEAGRALAVVEKKLARQLSTAATVSELIQQATDEKNLAVLFCGWAAYA